MGKKSNAQINRMKRRAAARGEQYKVPSDAVESKKNTRMLSAALKLRKELNRIQSNSELKAKDRRSGKRRAEAIAAEEADCTVEELLEWYDQHRAQEEADSSSKSATDDEIIKRKVAAAIKLRKELKSIESNEELKAKERRSAKRKAEAIAADDAGCPTEELLQWYDQHVHKSDFGVNAESAEDEEGGPIEEMKVGRNPYIVFVGQMAYTTTKENLFKHIQRELGKEHTVTEETVRIRLLTDPKTKKSRGMAFVETTDPELLYAFLKLHHTQLDGRRINVERSAGGKRNSDARKSKISQYRNEQELHMSETVDKMLSDYCRSGDLEEHELDEGVVTLCKRHSAATVEAALEQYVEARGRDMDNPSAYLTYIIGRIATEGIGEQERNKGGPKNVGGGGFNRRDGGAFEQNKKRRQPKAATDSTRGTIGNKLRKTSEFSKAGIDMSISDSSQGSGADLSMIFPSMRRGRGRGYM